MVPEILGISVGHKEEQWQIIDGDNVFLESEQDRIYGLTLPEWFKHIYSLSFFTPFTSAGTKPL